MKLFVGLVPWTAGGRRDPGERTRLGTSALELSVSAASAPLREFRRDDEGAPVPQEGWHWSTTNTRGLCAGVVAPAPVGLDAEWVHRPRIGAVTGYFRASDDGELDLLPGTERERVLRLWTLKEAVLKVTGIGIADLARCRVVGRASDDAWRLRLSDREWNVLSFPWKEHWLAVACDAERFEVETRELATSSGVLA